MRTALRYAAQAAVYAVIGLALGWLSQSPAYEAFPPGMAQVKLSLAHSGRPKGECRRLSREELAKLAPNMRRPVSCPRERVPVAVELRLDDRLIFAGSAPPTGLSGDGPSRIYERFAVPPGRYNLTAKLRDTGRTEGFDYEREVDIELRPGQSLAVDFRAETGGFHLY